MRSSTAHLSAALQRVARLDDQLEVQRAGFVEEKTKGLALLAVTWKKDIDAVEAGWRFGIAVDDRWMALTGGWFDVVIVVEPQKW